MSVNWLWSNKVGEIRYFAVKEKVSWKLDIYSCNGLVCFIYNFREDDKEMYNFFGFFNDLKHAKRVLKNDKDFFKSLPTGNHKLRKIRLLVSDKSYGNWFRNQMLLLAKLLVSYKYKVELY